MPLRPIMTPGRYGILRNLIESLGGDRSAGIKERLRRDGNLEVSVRFQFQTQYNDVGLVSISVQARPQEQFLAAEDEVVIKTILALGVKHNIRVGDYSYMKIAQKRTELDDKYLCLDNVKETLDDVVTGIRAVAGALRQCYECVNAELVMHSGLCDQSLEMLLIEIEQLQEAMLLLAGHTQKSVRYICGPDLLPYLIATVKRYTTSTMEVDLELCNYELKVLFEDGMRMIFGHVPPIAASALPNGLHVATMSGIYEGEPVVINSDEMGTARAASSSLYFKALEYARERLGYQIWDVFHRPLGEMEEFIRNFETKMDGLYKLTLESKNEVVYARQRVSNLIQGIIHEATDTSMKSPCVMNHMERALKGCVKVVKLCQSILRHKDEHPTHS